MNPPRLPFKLSITKRGLHIGPPRERKQTPQTNAHRYDAASTNRHTENHFKFADGLDANAKVGSAQQIVRNRVRSEIRNDPYAAGMSQTMEVEVIGPGPRFKAKTKDEKFNAAFEEGFGQWCGTTDSIEPAQCDLTGKRNYAEMIGMIGSVMLDDAGEGFIIMQSDRRLRATGKVSLKLLLAEADRCQTPFGMFDGKLPNGNELVQGIEMDKWGAPVKYYFLKRHPGSNIPGLTSFYEYDTVDAEQVIHLANLGRVGQVRGMPRFTPSLTVLAQLRDYRAATLSAAKTAASISGVIETGSEELDEIDDVAEFETVDIERDALLTLPLQSKMHQYKPEQPTASYKEFKNEGLIEAARPTGLPRNKATGDSSEYNYASGRLDHQGFEKLKNKIRTWIDRTISNRVALAWLTEARLIRTYKHIYGTEGLQVKGLWFWTGDGHQDPVKEAKAQDVKLKNGSTTHADEYGKDGKDWEVQMEQRAKELKKAKELCQEYDLPEGSLTACDHSGQQSQTAARTIDDLVEAVEDLIESKG